MWVRLEGRLYIMYKGLVTIVKMRVLLADLQNF